MKDIILTFGKYKNRRISEVDIAYLQWLSDKAYSPEIRAIAREWYVSQVIDEEEAEFLQDLALQEREWHDDKVVWEVDGHVIVVRPDVVMGPGGQMESGYSVSVDGALQYYTDDNIVECIVPGRPDIIARIGNVGLTSERLQAIRKV